MIVTNEYPRNINKVISNPIKKQVQELNFQSNAKDKSMGKDNWYNVIKVQSKMFKQSNQHV